MDIVVSPGFISHLDLQWIDPRFSRFLNRLASFGRLILYDKPGTGLSDPIPHLPALEERCADIEAVLDAAGSREAVLLGISEGGPASILLASTQPERVAALILYGTFAVTPSAAPEAYPLALTRSFESTFAIVREMVEHWGDGASAEIFAPGLSDGRHRAYGMFERAAASPRMARALIQTALQIDVREILPSIHAPTLVLHFEGDRVIPVEAGGLLAERIPGARLATFPGGRPSLLGERLRPAGGGDRALRDRRRSGGRARSSAGDGHVHGHRRLHQESGADGRSRLARSAGASRRGRPADRQGERGRVVKRIGDGALSAFDGPARAIRCAEALRTALADLGVELRTGIHTGECEAIGDDLGGLAVHIGARVGAVGAAGEIMVSSTVKELVVGSGLQFADRGEQELKGVPGTWRIYALDADPPQALSVDAASEHMRALDRVAVGMARRAPRAMRFGARLAGAGHQAD